MWGDAVSQMRIVWRVRLAWTWVVLSARGLLIIRAIAVYVSVESYALVRGGRSSEIVWPLSL